MADETRFGASFVSRIELRFLAVFVPAMFAVLVALTSGYEWHVYQKASDNLRHRLTAITSNLSIVMAESLANDDHRQVRLLLANIIADEAVSAIRISGMNGEIIDSFGDFDNQPEEWRATQRVNFVDNDSYRQVGQVDLAFTDSHLVERAYQRLGFAAISVGIMLLAAVAIVHVSYSRSVGRPITELRRAVRETEGRSRRRVEWHSDDEIGELVTAYNDLQEREENSLRLLQETQRDLERRVSERTRDLELATSEAILASRVKTEFLAAMSHEFRTPLNAIMGFGDLLKEDVTEMPVERRQEYIREIVRSGDILLTLVSKLFDFSRLESGTLDVAPAPMNPSREVQSVLVAERLRAAPRSISIDYQTNLSGDCFILADAERYRQVVANLLGNAIKYNRPNGRVFVTLDSPLEGWCRLTVRDTGLGIPDDLRDRIFNPFDRLGREAGAIDGAGVGLTLAKRLTENMGGRISFTSVPGEGSTFWIEFPLLSAERADVPPA
ncbi:MAG: ATP-binding protein [Rhodospirillales bacterium]